VGPGYLMANPEYSDEPWSKPDEAVRYLPMQAQPGDFAFFVRNEGVEIQYQHHQFLIIRHASILALIRPDSADIIEQVTNLLR
ncbi:MAG: co-chaperone GroES, partial [Candidatus Eremiobacteraeota bacterium]|nr:co-chaperone GroES [Candidatus Eremiobacteraeota bacterium]